MDGSVEGRSDSHFRRVGSERRIDRTVDVFTATTLERMVILDPEGFRINLYATKHIILHS
jgi:transcriptional regulator of aromatic amino acid metabolism